MTLLVETRKNPLPSPGALPEPKKKSRFITLTSADVESIIKPPVESRKLDEADMRILVTLMKTDYRKRLSVHTAAGLIEPERAAIGYGALASVPSRIELYNIMLSSPPGEMRVDKLDDSYYISSPIKSARTRNAYLKEKIYARLQKEKWGNIQYRLAHGKVDDGIALAIFRGNEQTTTVRFHDLDYQDPAASRDFGEKQPKYELRASKQVKLMQLLFQTGPVPVRIAKNALRDDLGSISTRELQLYIDILNGTLKIDGKTTEKLRTEGICMTRSAITQLGLRIGHDFLDPPSKGRETRIQEAGKGEEVIFLKKHLPTSVTSELLNQYDTNIFDPNPTRVRIRRKKPKLVAN